MGVTRVLQVLTIMNRGGAETMIMNYYRNMDRSKVQFDFLLHRQERGVFDDEIERLGGKIYRLERIDFGNLGKYRKALNEFFKQNTQYDIVHSHLNAFSVFVLKAAQTNKVPVRIAHSHTSQYNLNLNPFSKNTDSLAFAFKFFAQNFFRRNVPKYANHYYACGHKAGVWLFGKKNSDKIVVINNAIDAAQFSYSPEMAAQKKKQLGVNGKLVIGHVGNFVPEKNHPFLLQVFNELKKLKKDCELILVGGGDKTRFEHIVDEMNLENDVHFLGVRSDVTEILQAIDIFLFPSTNEGLPVTLIEAQASGLCIVASDEISNELDITGLVDFLPLNQSPAIWAQTLFEKQNYSRENTRDKIKSGNYDIENNAKMLQEFYCNTIN